MSNSLEPHGLQPSRLLCPWNPPGKNTGVGCHFLLQGIFPTQGLNLGLLHCRRSLYCLSHQGNSLLQEPQETQDFTILPWRTRSMKNSLISDTNPVSSSFAPGSHSFLCLLPFTRISLLVLSETLVYGLDPPICLKTHHPPFFP